MQSGKFSGVAQVMKNAAIVGLLSLGFASTTVYADDQDVTEVKHVYVDGVHIGIVEKQSTVEQFVDETIDKKQQDSETDYTYAVAEDITYVSEKVFESNADKAQVFNQLEDELTLQVKAKALEIGGEVVGYFADEETAQQVVEAYKQKFVDNDLLEKLESGEDDTSLELGDSTIIDVQLTNEVSIKQEKVLEKEILSVEEGLTLLEKGTLENKQYTVEEGDVLGSIAGEFDLSLDELLELNEGLTEDSIIRVGDELNVTAFKPYVEVMVTEEKLVEETISYETEIVESEEMYKGDEKVRQEGQDGKKEVHYQLEKVNGVTVKTEVLDENITQKPNDKVIVKGTKVVPSRGSGHLQWPAVGGYITSHVGERWGSFHKGIDIAGVSNRSILAADNGTVVSAGWDNGGYGNKIVIDHNNGYRTIYAHLSSISVSSGQTVEQGKKIGVMGSTGHSTGIHLHFEVYKNGSLQNPADIF
ncbi:M23 family metallopeptidase [Gracilibacillus sp. YIM 98692]|uniref:peptidoglycan DD-metalloendopeptidase family protein n=1 Tax=Gracilibacillus sp. YIM 98692 TaxID=2663532 RepID=UPI0013D0043A|nr:M23 family metallopeptidase [Gracilibacillus sp. YIM 98692]